MVVAKNDAAHQELARQFHDREVEKEYIALVWGVVQAGRRIDAAIGRDPVESPEDVDARAAAREGGHADHARASPARRSRCCQVAIHTGRTHQIRVHLSAIGHPIVGDSTLRRRPSTGRRRHPGGAAADASVPARRASGVHASERRPAHASSSRQLPDDLTSGARRSVPDGRPEDEGRRNRTSTPLVPTARFSTVFQGASSPSRSKRSRCPRAASSRPRSSGIRARS